MAKKEALIEEVIEKPYSLRKLKDGDLFPLLSLLRKLGIKDFKNALIQVADGKSINEIGALVLLDIADTVIEHIGGQAGEDIYSFWADLSGIPSDEIKEMEFGTLPMMIMDTFSEVKNTSFFKVLSKLL